MEDSKSCITVEASSIDDEMSMRSSSQPLEMESCLPGNNFLRVAHDLLSFETQIERRFLTANAIYRFTCGKTGCGFTYGVPHLALIIRVRGLANDQIGLILQSSGKVVENILPQVPKPRYSYRTWRNSR